MSDPDTDPAYAESPAAEYAELVHLILDSAWTPGDIFCTSDGVTWQFREDVYTSDFPETLERHASGSANESTSATRWRTFHSR